MELRVASVQYPVVSRIEYDADGNIIGGSGFFQDILMTLAHESALNFSRTLMPPIDGNVGALVGTMRNGNLSLADLYSVFTVQSCIHLILS